MGLLFYLGSFVLSALCFPFGLLYMLYSHAKGAQSVRHFLRSVDNHFKLLALVRDCYGNVYCKDLFNRVLITEKGYRFGKRKETISSALGKNKLKGTFRKPGEVLDSILNDLDPDHSVNSIDELV